MYLNIYRKACICLEISEKDRRALTDKMKPEYQQALLNLIYLGINP